jgi:hypothetical protein
VEFVLAPDEADQGTHRVNLPPFLGWQLLWAQVASSFGTTGAVGRPGRACWDPVDRPSQLRPSGLRRIMPMLPLGVSLQQC